MNSQKFSQKLGMIYGLCLGLTVACSSNSSKVLGTSEDSEISGKNAVGQVRYVCADDVIPRNEKLEALDDKGSPLLQAGAPVTLLSGQKSGFGDLAGHRFVQVKLKDGKQVWISASFLKASTCAGTVSKGRINGSVLHFTGDAPGVLAMLDAIAYAEFRGHSESTSESAYKTIVDYRAFSDFSGHPRLLVRRSDSDAAGRYQFISTSWDDAQRYISENRISEITWLKGRMPDFSPASQDKMAIFKMWWRFGYTPLKSIRYGDSATLNQVTRRLAGEWASLPGSKYGQGTLDWSTFSSYYWTRYRLYNQYK